MNITIIPDQHGESHWKKVYNLKSDYYISLGDWFDSFIVPPSLQIQNFIEYMEWVKQDPEHRITCIGNHDLAYMTTEKSGASVSGHNLDYHDEICNLLYGNFKYLKLFFILDDIVFSHAGFSNTWINRFNINLKHLKNNWIHYYDKLTFVQPKLRELIDTPISPVGDNVWQSPLWIRPNSLIKDSFFDFQIVGHTEICTYSPAFIQKDGKKFIFCDSVNHNLITTINTNEIKDDEKYYFGQPDEYKIIG